ncbi:ATP-binding protein [Neoaquamicrobium sediminum]|uniref:ATP-binding protein n=1 Tax=Neoaquamicrobium sediminum TaxID=1849104 RepID=UPI001567614B|nr:sensor histidine kinase [Mesorhizobium sediminum]
MIANAIRHTQQGAKIGLTCGHEQGWPFIIVADNGPGIPEAERAKVFKRFYRLEKAEQLKERALVLASLRPWPTCTARTSF